MEGIGARLSWTMAPPRDVVKIAVQMRDAIPQLIQLDQVTQPLPPLTSGSPPSPRNSPPYPFLRFFPNFFLLLAQ